MFKAILLPVDLASGDGERKPLELAVGLARQGGGAIHAVTVVPDFGMSIVGSYFDADFERKALNEAAEKLKAWIATRVPEGVKVEAHVAHGRIYDEILKAAERIGCDAIVLGAHRPDFSDYLLGPNAARVVRHARQSVLVVRD